MHFGINRQIGPCDYLVYEVSLHLSVVFNSPAQTTSIISHLVPDLYQRAPELPPTVSWAALISAFHFLVAAYPSQSRCSEHLALLPSSFLPKDAPPHKWLSDVMRALRSRNFARFESLTKDDKIKATFSPRAPCAASQISDDESCMYCDCAHDTWLIEEMSSRVDGS